MADIEGRGETARGASELEDLKKGAELKGWKMKTKNVWVHPLTEEMIHITGTYNIVKNKETISENCFDTGEDIPWTDNETLKIAINNNKTKDTLDNAKIFLEMNKEDKIKNGWIELKGTKSKKRKSKKRKSRKNNKNNLNK